MSWHCTTCGKKVSISGHDCPHRNSSALEERIKELEQQVKILEAKLEPCDTCGSIDCEDASMEYYIKRWKEAEKRVTELEAELHQIYLDEAGEQQ